MNATYGLGAIDARDVGPISAGAWRRVSERGLLIIIARHRATIAELMAKADTAAEPRASFLLTSAVAYESELFDVLRAYERVTGRRAPR